MRSRAVGVLLITGFLVGCGEKPVTQDHLLQEAIAEIDSLETLVANLERWRGRACEHLITDVEIEGLKRNGLSDPPHTLVGDLVEHPELIPFNEHLEDTEPDFYFHPEGINVISNRWVYAEVENGDFSGRLLLGYEARGGEVLWEVIEARIH